MLKKLLKYEFRATARTYGGMYLALLAASVLFGGSVWRWNSTNSDAYSTLVGLLSLVYTAVIIGTVVVTIMTIVQRFYRNLLGREGYLMHTLPVTETQLVTSKLISSTVWSLCSILAACLSFGILAVLMMADMDLLEQLPRMWSGIREAFARCNMEFWEALAFSGVVGFVRMVSAIACIYAACMVGHQFKNHPALAGILSFFVMPYVQGWLGESDVCRSEDIPLENDKDYVMSLLAVLTGGDRSADFTVQELDGERRENGYAIPELQISRKENNE